MGTPVDVFDTEEIERVLCGLRVSQMTQTYEDLEAITSLLEEKQNDLELAAEIGKNLLAKNHELERRLSETEKKLVATEDTISQLKHNLSVKDSLLQIYSQNNHDDTDDHTSVSSGCLSPPPGAISDSGEGFSIASVNFSQLNRKLRDLEEENYVLRQEHHRLVTTTDQLDERESSLIRDCARQLVSANMHIRTLSDELAKKSDAFMNQQSEVTRLLTRGLDLENRVKQLASENQMLVNRLRESQTTQERLTHELVGMRDKYDECLSLFSETRAEVRALRKRSRRAYLRPGYLSFPGTVGGNSATSTPCSAAFPPYSTTSPTGQGSPTVQLSLPPEGSSDGSSSSFEVLANAMANPAVNEDSLAADLARTAAMDRTAENVSRLFRVMEQARQARDSADGAHSPRHVTGLRPPDYGPEDTVSSSGFVSGSEPSERIPRASLRASTVPPDFEQRRCNSLTKCSEFDNNQSAFRNFYQPDSDHTYTPIRALVQDEPKRHSWVGCIEDVPGELRSSRKAVISDSPPTKPILSSNPSALYSDSCSRLPQRLKLVKPLDGSEVLHHWQRLATPSFTRALFESLPPGIQSRAGVAKQSAPPPMLSNGHRQRQGSVPLDLLTEHSEERRSSTVTPRQSDNTTADLDRRGRDARRKAILSGFGLDLSSHLFSDVRSRSLEQLQTCGSKTGRNYFPRSTSGNSSIGTRFDMLSKRLGADESPLADYPFSLSSLVNAFLPFSLSPVGAPQSHPNSQRPSTSVGFSREPINIRPRSPQRSRGLLEVGSIGSQPPPPAVQRIAASSSLRADTPIPPANLPSPIPPPTAPRTYVRPNYSRTVRNPNLSEITEETGSPPKSDESRAESSSPPHVAHPVRSVTKVGCTDHSC
ncbi:unnamed protein product [Calicophoron daubneyi]|uniref:HAP1 N-terminal domain-containing protein n=1 Tax=Calicophoron daubneyi TaxID=300641 RepID=A0AAV2TL40_CALDB